MKYLNNINTIEELKKQYKKMAMELHPDRGGDQEDFKILVNEYELLLKKLQTAAGATKESIQLESQYQDIVNQLIKFDGLTIEILGTWIWISGNTYPAKDAIKALGFQYQGRKKMWFLAPEGTEKKKVRKSFTHEEVKAMHGVKAKIKTEGNKKLK